MTREKSTPRPTTGGIRVFSRAHLTQAWLAEHALPAWREARDGGRRLAYLRRGWRFGPHVDVVVDAATPGELADLTASLAAGVRPGAEPEGEAAFTEAEYLPLARELGRMESVEPPYLPMRRHGDVDVLTPDQVGGEAPELDELRLVCASALAVPVAATLDDLATAPAGGSRRLAEIVAAMVDVHTLGMGYGVFSLHSHAEGFFAWTAPTTDVRPAFERRYEGEADLVREVVRTRMDGGADAVATGWRNALGYCSGVVDAAVSRGAVTGSMLDAVADNDDVSMTGPPGSPDQGPTGAQPDTEFHRAVHGAGVESLSGAWFTGYRLLVNLTYEQLPLLGVAPLQRYYTCYAVARAVDEELGSTWRDRLPVTPPAGATATDEEAARV